MAVRNITGNYLICGNEVFVEGKSIGQFQSFESDETRENIVGTASIEMPFYTIAAKAAKEVGRGSTIAVQRVGKNTTTYIRINPDDWNIKTGARIQVYAWYHDNAVIGQKFEKRLEFDGFIRDVIGGFPTVIKCEDAAFMLRFGTVTQSWPKATPLSSLLQQMCDTANAAFAKYRKDNKLYGNVRIESDRARVYCGLGISESESPTVELDTSVNVIARDIVPSDMMFQNFRVIVRYLEDGTMKTIEKGAENGLVYDLPFTPGRNAQQMNTTALSVLAGLRAQRNKGTITTLLYPLVRLYDYVNFNDTIFKSLSGGYYVIGRKVTCGKGKGYRQILTVTNKTFLYLAN